MSKKRPSDEQLRSALNLGVTTPMQQEARLAPSDPVISMPMKVDIRQIELYDRNPRRSQNSAYEDIKQSVRAQGLKQPLVITRRPGAERYMLKHGGNTRLTVLKELHAETGDRRFQQADCVFEPWQGETDVLVSHIVENEVRGSLTFIDKARAVREAAAMFEADTGDKLSLRQLSDALRERGFRISAGMISKCFYALDTLLQAIPTALDTGIGKPQIEKLRQLQTGAKQVWDNHRLGSAEMFEAVFVEALAQADGETWNHENAWRSVEVALAQRAAEPMNRIAAELDALLVGGVGTDEEPGAMSRTPASVQDRLEDFGPRTEEQRPAAAPRGTDGRTAAPADTPPRSSTRESPPAQASPASVFPVETPTAGSENDALDSAEKLRQRMFETAHRAAAELGLAPCVTRYAQGAGYLVTQFPPAGFVHGDPNLVQATSWWWWFLVSMSETLEVPPLQARKLFPSDSPVAQAHVMRDEQARYEAMFAQAGAPDVSRFGFCVLTQMSASLLKAYRQLEDDYRALSERSRQRGQSFHAQEV
ncbi:MAG: ParB N-terminal domain-containing protein [Stagnimonas sp.]|nr:ParB N-terminal domain-containing protein [Stagnimonas sp.]